MFITGRIWLNLHNRFFKPGFAMKWQIWRYRWESVTWLMMSENWGNLLSSTRLSHVISRIHFDGLGCTCFRSNDAPPWIQEYIKRFQLSIRACLIGANAKTVLSAGMEFMFDWLLNSKSGRFRTLGGPAEHSAPKGRSFSKHHGDSPFHLRNSQNDARLLALIGNCNLFSQAQDS